MVDGGLEDHDRVGCDVPGMSDRRVSEGEFGCGVSSLGGLDAGGKFSGDEDVQVAGSSNGECSLSVTHLRDLLLTVDEGEYSGRHQPCQGLPLDGQTRARAGG